MEGWKWIGNGQYSVRKDGSDNRSRDSEIAPTACWSPVRGNSNSRQRKLIFISLNSTVFGWLTFVLPVDTLNTGKLIYNVKMYGNEEEFPLAKKAVVLLSGGIDSTTMLAIAKSQGYETYAMSFRYGQRHALELERAIQIAESMDVKKHNFVEIDLRSFGGSALTDDIEVPRDRSQEEMGTGIPVTYVPARNTIFLSFALAWAETLEADAIFIGVNALDYSGYPDCRPEYIEAFQGMADLATKAGVEGRAQLKIQTPLILMTKAEIIRKGAELGVDYGLTFSCYDPDDRGRACGTCDSCLLRKMGFIEAGISDPTEYQSSGQ